VTAWLTENVLGITVVEPGCSTLQVKPHLGDLEWVEGTFPTPHGVVRVRHERLPNGEISSQIDAPKEVKIIR
jgi:hypothetical protein